MINDTTANYHQMTRLMTNEVFDLHFIQSTQ